MTDENRPPWEQPAAEPPCNRVHVRKGACQLLYGHVGPCIWQQDVWGKTPQVEEE